MEEFEGELELLRELYQDARRYMRYDNVDTVRADNAYKDIIRSVHKLTDGYQAID